MDTTLFVCLFVGLSSVCLHLMHWTGLFLLYWNGRALDGLGMLSFIR